MRRVPVLATRAQVPLNVGYRVHVVLVAAARSARIDAADEIDATAASASWWKQWALVPRQLWLCRCRSGAAIPAVPLHLAPS